MSYDLYDVDGYVGPLASTAGLKELRVFAQRAKLYNLSGFLEQGSALVTEVFINELKKVRARSNSIQSTVDSLVDLLERKAELAVFITDGVHNGK